MRYAVVYLHKSSRVWLMGETNQTTHTHVHIHCGLFQVRPKTIYESEISPPFNDFGLMILCYVWAALLGYYAAKTRIWVTVKQKTNSRSEIRQAGEQNQEIDNDSELPRNGKQ